MRSHRVAVIPGDGIGLEVIEAGKQSQSKARVRERQPGTVERTDPVENSSPGGRGPNETMLDRRD